MFQSDQFVVNEAWIVFKLNDLPICTEQDGDFDFLALMDAASGFILSSVPVSATQLEPSSVESKQLLDEGKAYKQSWPKTLFVPLEQAAQRLATEAGALGINVIRVAEEQLLAMIGEAQEGFREQFGRRSLH